MHNKRSTMFPFENGFLQLIIIGYTNPIFIIHKLSHPESRSDPIGGSEPVSETRDSGLGLFFFFFLNRTDTCGYGPHLITGSKYHIHLQSPIYIYKTELLQIQIRARSLHVVNPYKCVGPAVCGCLLMSSPVPTRIKNPC